MHPRAGLTLVFLAGQLLVAPVATASDPKAESLFQEGLEMMKARDYARACLKLESSLTLERRSGTLISVAYCHERVGRTATAWAEYREAATMARANGRTNYEEKARALADKLEPDLAKISIVAPARHTGADLTIALDGESLPEGTFGSPVPVDPGPRSVVVTAPGYAPWSMQVTAVAAETVRVEIPQLRRAVESDLGAIPADTTEPPPSQPVAPDVSVGSKDVVPDWAAWAFVGAGAAAATAGLVLGGIALGKKSTVEQECDLTRRTCSQAGLDARDGGRALTTASTLLVVAGAVVSATGATLLLLGGDETDADAHAKLTLGGASVWLEGRF